MFGAGEVSSATLRDGAGPQIERPYVALSHCWGNSPMLKLADAALPYQTLKKPVFI